MAVTGCLSLLNAAVRHAARAFPHARRLAGHHAPRHVHRVVPASPGPGLSPACRATDVPYRAMHRATDAAGAPSGSGAVAKAAGGAALAAAAAGAGVGYHAFGTQGGGAAPGVGTGSLAWPDLTGAQMGAQMFAPGTLPSFASAGPELPGAVQAIPLTLASPASAFEAAAPAPVPEASSVLILASGLLAVTLLKASRAGR